MSHFIHCAIVVTGWDRGHADEARAMAVTLGLRPTEAIVSSTNAFASFMVPPFGSDSGDEESRRNLFKIWLRRAERLEWCEVTYGDDAGTHGGADVTDHGWRT